MAKSSKNINSDCEENGFQYSVSPSLMLWFWYSFKISHDFVPEAMCYKKSQPKQRLYLFNYASWILHHMDKFNKVWWYFEILQEEFLSLRVFRLLSLSLLLYSQGFSWSVFQPSSGVLCQTWHETPEGSQKMHQPKCSEYNNKDEDNSPDTLSDKNYPASSQKFRQIIQEEYFGLMLIMFVVQYHLWPFGHYKKKFVTKIHFSSVCMSIYIYIYIYIYIVQLNGDSNSVNTLWMWILLYPRE